MWWLRASLFSVRFRQFSCPFYGSGREILNSVPGSDSDTDTDNAAVFPSRNKSTVPAARFRSQPPVPKFNHYWEESKRDPDK